MAVGVVLVGAVLFGVFSGTKGAHLELQGKVLKARTGAMDDSSSIAVLDFRISNPSNILFQVRDVKMTLERKDSSEVEGQVISKQDVKVMFQANKFLGVAFNEPLTIRDKVNAHSQIDRMAAARFENVKQADMDEAKSITLTIEDMDGPEVRLVHKLP